MIDLQNIKKQTGIGIIELMVSITIGLFILAGVVQLYLTSTQNVSAFEGSSRIQENARYAFARFEKDIGKAGNMGCFSAAFVEEPALRVQNNLGKDAAIGELYDFSSFISGEDDVGPGAKGATSTDKIIVRYADTDERFGVIEINEASSTFKIGPADTETKAALGEIEVGQVLVIGDCSKSTIFSASAVDADAYTITHAQGVAGGDNQYNTTASLGAKYMSADPNNVEEGVSFTQVYLENSGAILYEIDDSAAGVLAGQSCSSSTPQYCALKRNDLEIVEGVEDIQFEYGWLNAENLFFADAATIEARADKADVWRLIDRVRVSATFNSINSATTNEGLGLLARTYSQVFVVHNQLPASI